MIQIRQPSFWSKTADALMIPIMYFLQGNIFELPQKTHFWNNCKLTRKDASSLDSSLCVTVVEQEHSVPRWFGPVPIFHMPIFGGWKTFVVLEPVDHSVTEWYVGWIASDVAGLSQIKLTAQVRLLTCEGSAEFFGVTKNGTQIALQAVGHGKIGEQEEYAKVPLL